MFFCVSITTASPATGVVARAGDTVSVSVLMPTTWTLACVPTFTHEP
jgi:hypothetical protein